ncbi:DUF2550 domain-containing protein [Tessaracoccus sp. OS52]|uniref:DUF2550 domain-containing protein n=1 Tax=Tessaracoccus sp. OS52 TaxID=2886691 RepID=UPI001D103A46|nr:DUF2550 domain-containing protein [Tessaracoccus sp. OS52]MCC2593052.1 DUF2550 domain-containing protein [Tessaracoccus sp. OS52]
MDLGAALIVVGVAVLLCVPFVALYVRRRWLTGHGGLFDCAYRASEGVPGSGWVLGLARYRGDQLEWYRAFSLALRPALEFQRGVTTFAHQRPSSGLEAVVLFDESRIVTLRDRVTSREHSLAMDPDAAMALMSWLESAPPGSHYLPHSADSPI